MAKATQVSICNRTRSELVLQTAAKKKGDGFLQEKITFTRTERDGTKEEYEDSEVVLFGKEKSNFQGYPVTMAKSDWEKLLEQRAVKGLVESQKIMVS